MRDICSSVGRSLSPAEKGIETFLSPPPRLLPQPDDAALAPLKRGLKPPVIVNASFFMTFGRSLSPAEKGIETEIACSLA